MDEDRSFKSVLITEKKPIRNEIVILLLEQYNKKVEERIYLEESIERGCFSDSFNYKFYREIGDMKNHYTEGRTLSERDTIRWLIRNITK